MLCTRLHTDQLTEAQAFLLNHKGTISIERDLIGVGRDADSKAIVALIAACPTYLVHTFAVAPHPRARLRAAELAQFGIGYLRGEGQRDDLVFHVDDTNLAMKRVLYDLGARNEKEPVDIFHLETELWRK